LLAYIVYPSLCRYLNSATFKTLIEKRGLFPELPQAP